MISELATSLYQKSQDKPDFKAIDIGANTGIVFPYYEYFISAGPLDFLPPFIRESFAVGMSIWGAENIPESWKLFLLEVIKEREAKGIRSPVSPFSVAVMILEEDAELTEQVKELLHLNEIEMEEIICDSNAVRTIFTLFMNTPNLQDRLRSKLIDFMYSHSAHWVDTYEVEQFIDKMGIRDGVIVDIGSGIGDNTNSLVANDRNNLIVGLDRQYYPERFDDEWVNGKASFAQAEAEHLPFPAHSIDLVTMISVVGHLTPEVIDVITSDVLRVLKLNGYFVVGPQKVTTGLNMYRYFQKTEANRLIEVNSKGELLEN